MSREFQLAQNRMEDCCFCSELDSLKEINESKGRDIGDLALRAFAKSIYSNIRDDDELFRLGGDEFVVITSNVSRTIAHRMIERILLHISQVQRPVRLSGSIGAVHLTQNTSLASALSLAEKELYTVKNSNRGTYSVSCEYLLLIQQCQSPHQHLIQRVDKRVPF